MLIETARGRARHQRRVVDRLVARQVSRRLRAPASHARAAQREDLWLKFHVVEALGEIGDRAALPAILPLYAEKSLRKPVLEAIGKIADVGTVNFLLRIIADEEKLNLTALRALVRIAEAEQAADRGSRRSGS